MRSIHALIRSFSDPWKLQRKQLWLYSCSLPFCEGRILFATLHTVEIGNSFHKMQNCLPLQYAFCSGSNDEGIELFFRHLYSIFVLNKVTKAICLNALCPVSAQAVVEYFCVTQVRV